MVLGYWHFINVMSIRMIRLEFGTGLGEVHTKDCGSVDCFSN